MSSLPGSAQTLTCSHAADTLRTSAEFLTVTCNAAGVVDMLTTLQASLETLLSGKLRRADSMYLGASLSLGLA